MMWLTFILLGIVLGLLASHAAVTMRLGVHQFVRRVRGLLIHFELNLTGAEKGDEDDKPRRLKG